MNRLTFPDTKIRQKKLHERQYLNDLIKETVFHAVSFVLFLYQGKSVCSFNCMDFISFFWADDAFVTCEHRNG